MIEEINQTLNWRLEMKFFENKLLFYVITAILSFLILLGMTLFVITCISSFVDLK